MHEMAPVTYRGRSDEPQRAGVEETITMTAKWSILWKSLIMSTIGQTMFPYCQYIRALDLSDLAYLFEDGQFNGKLFEYFFEGMDSIVGTGVPKVTRAGRVNKRGWNASATVQSIGEVLVQKSPLIEELSGGLSGDLDSATLHAWIPKLNKLREIQLWSGTELSSLGPIIQTECPNLTSFKFYNWDDADENAEEPSSTLLRDLKPQSLQSFRILGRAQIGALTLSSLSTYHGTSLTDLVVTDMPSEAVPELGLLKSCTSLRSLSLSEQNRSTDLKTTHLGAFEDVVEWLRGCKQLRRVKFTSFLSGASILTPLFLDNSLRLEELELSHYTPESGPAFYSSLDSQAKTLRELLLRSESMDAIEQIDSATMEICKLRRLRVLHLRNVSDFFRNEHVINIASSLRSLEELVISGWGINDEVWEALAGLHSLRRADLYAYSEFTFEGIIRYVEQLGEGNKEMLLGISMASPHMPLSEDEQSIIRQMIAGKVDGRFEYTTARDPDAEDFTESDSD